MRLQVVLQGGKGAVLRGQPACAACMPCGRRLVAEQEQAVNKEEAWGAGGGKGIDGTARPIRRPLKITGLAQPLRPGGGGFRAVRGDRHGAFDAGVHFHGVAAFEPSVGQRHLVGGAPPALDSPQPDRQRQAQAGTLHEGSGRRCIGGE